MIWYNIDTPLVPATMYQMVVGIGGISMPNQQAWPVADEERFWPKVEETDTCWLWTGILNHYGYGVFTVQALNVPAHRWAYEYIRELIPDGMTLDHLCRVRNCVRPDHLEVVTNGENVLRGVSASAINARKTHCIRGHEFTEANTIVTPRKAGRQRTGRRCRTCATARENSRPQRIR